MSRTIRRGKPSRNFHKYIGLGVIANENRMTHSYWVSTAPYRYWMNGTDDETTYEEYAELKIRQYHMDFRPWNKCPNYVNRMDIQYHRRQSKRALFDAIRTGEYDVNLPVMGRVGKRIWDWW